MSALLNDDHYLAVEVAEVIKYDQAITANILKMSNSVYYGMGQNIRTIVDMMGLDGGADCLAHRWVGEGLKKFKLWSKDIEESFILLAEDLKRAKDMIAII